MPTLSEGPTRWAADSMTAKLRYLKYRGNGVRAAKVEQIVCKVCSLKRPAATIKRGKCDVCKGKGK